MQKYFTHKLRHDKKKTTANNQFSSLTDCRFQWRFIACFRVTPVPGGRGLLIERHHGNLQNEQ